MNEYHTTIIERLRLVNAWLAALLFFSVLLNLIFIGRILHV